MQTLQAGSFLNLENDQGVEALKFTARRLAEHSEGVVAENLNAAALENLANNLWEKAEYVARETERRRLKQIFVENFSERYRELKPDVSETGMSGFAAGSNTSTIENADSVAQSPVPEIIETGESEGAAVESVSSSAASTESATAAQEKRDEFLGFVKAGESLEESSMAESEAKTTIVPEEIAQTAHETVSELLNPENQSAEAVTANIEDKTARQTGSAEKQNDAKPQITAVAGKSEREATSVSKNSNPATKAEEPFDFEKCTISLNLTLLHAEAGSFSSRRRAIIGAASHDLPPEIDFLEIAEGDDLTKIADLVREKLARFKQTLPVKYIEQLRASKTNSAKTIKTAKASAPTQPANNNLNNEKTSGEESGQEAISVEPEKTPVLEKAEENKRGDSSSKFAPTANPAAAANEIQQSLF
jgi:hypothetical protein